MFSTRSEIDGRSPDISMSFTSVDTMSILVMGMNLWGWGGDVLPVPYADQTVHISSVRPWSVPLLGSFFLKNRQWWFGSEYRIETCRVVNPLGPSYRFLSGLVHGSYITSKGS